MRQHWWKLLSVVILLYAFTVGMLVPLKPNLVSVSPAAASPGSTQTFEVVGYNTRFAEDGGATRAWLNLTEGSDLYSLEASTVEVIDDRRARVTFSLPPTLPGDRAGGVKLSMMMTGPANGTFVAPGTVFVRHDGADRLPGSASTITGWERDGLQKGDLIANASYTFPYRGLLSETIRNTYFHVSLWFAMMFLFIAGVVYAIIYLVRSRRADRYTAGALTDITRLERGGLLVRSLHGGRYPIRRAGLTHRGRLGEVYVGLLVEW